MPRCPGQDMRYWKPEDIFDVKCPRCGCKIEFWKDEPMRICKSCGKEIRNPRIDLGCAKWCKFADECLGKLPDIDYVASPVLDKLEELLLSRFKDSKEAIKVLKKTRKMAGDMIVSQDGEPCLITAASVLLVARMLEKDVSDSSEYSALLTEAGLDAQVAEKVEKLVNCINRSQGCEMKECSIVVDIAEIAKRTLLSTSTLNKQKLIDSLLTDSAKSYVNCNF